MADYKELLRRAISALPENNGAARRAVYEKARSALVGQLRAISPPLPARDITQHRLQLEDCIRRVEQEASEAFRQQQRFRVGIEGSLSVLVRRHALRRARLKGWEGFQRHVHLCVIGMNLLRLLDWNHRQAAMLAA